MTKVNSFWHGGDLTALELLCINSFLKNGFIYNLYVYELPRNIPQGVNIKNAEDIVSASKLFRYKAGAFNVGGISGFANLFRYMLLFEIGGWWVDTDHCCLKPFPVESEEYYFQEHTRNNSVQAVNGFFKTPKHSPVLDYCLAVFKKKDLSQLVHGETGPLLLTQALRQLNKVNSLVSPALFFPVPWWNYQRLLFDETLSLDHCFTVHFWNAKITGDGLNKNRQYPANSVFETLKRKYL